MCAHHTSWICSPYSGICKQYWILSHVQWSLSTKSMVIFAFYKNYWANVYNRQSIFFCSCNLIHGRLQDFYRVKLLMEVVYTAVLAISHVWNMHMCISSCSDMHVTIHKVWPAVQFSVSFINGLLVDQTNINTWPTYFFET